MSGVKTFHDTYFISNTNRPHVNVSSETLVIRAHTYM